MTEGKRKRGPESLLELAFTLSTQKDIDAVFQQVALKSVELLAADVILILMFNPLTHDTLKTIVKKGRATDDPRYRFVQSQVSGWILKNDQSLYSPNIRNDERFHKICFDKTDACSILGTPLKSDGQIIGTLIAFNTTCEHRFSEKDLAFLENISLIAAPYLHHIEKLAPYFKKPLPHSELVEKYKKSGLLGQCKKFISLLNVMDAAARSDVRVLLEGQSGTGKELVARAIHENSDRKSGPFIAIDCGAIPAALMESELFGHTKGAFTGATTDRKGLIEEANHGTLFMDEIINLPAEMQAKLLRFLQENEIRPVGGNKTRKVKVRIFAAASRSLSTAVKQGDFREDLYYRLFVYPISIPNLAQRKNDIPLLARHFLEKFAEQQQKTIKGLSGELEEFLVHRQWPGNIRELENFMERLVTLAPIDMHILDVSILPAKLVKEYEKSKSMDTHQINQSLSESLAEYEVQIICNALNANGWNQSQAARSLKISVQALRYKMKRLGIEHS